MDTVKERLIGAITLMSVEDATSLWEYVIDTHSPRISLDSVETTKPTTEEIEILKAYDAGEEQYQPSISHEDLKKELGLI